MNIVKYPYKEEWKNLLSRPALSVEGLYDRVQSVLDKVRTGGDAALREFELQFEKTVAPTSPEYVVESLRTVLNHHFNGAVLSWNIMEAPDSHIECLSVFQSK